MSKLRIMQFGRSMSEILGVLAVIGLLSITGLYGYHRAMNKHKANEITATIQRQLPLVAAALANETTPDDYYDEDVAGIGADIWLSEDRDGSEMLPRGTDKKFRMNVGKLPKELCKDLISSLRGAETKVHSITGDVNCDKDSNDLGIVYNADLSADCDAGYGRQDGFCEECADGLMSDGKTGCGECDPGTKASDNHQSCDPCEAGDTTCGCENKADGNGGCTDCIENGDCDSENMCYSGYCYSCPKYAECDPEKSGFKCRKGYDELDKLCCPPNANCSTEDNGSLIVSCSKNYYYQQTETDESCQPCEGIKHALSCKGGQEGLKCDKDEGYEMKNGGCCLIGAECDLNEEGEYEAKSCPEDTYLFDGECLTCPDGASCPGGDEGFTCDKDTYLSASGDECLICPENATCPGGMEGFECNPTYQTNEAGTGCECPENYYECGGECHAPCNGRGQTGRWDPESCGCLCKEGTDDKSCECPAGYVYADGQCNRLVCVDRGSLGFDCYLNNKKCAQVCKGSDYIPTATNCRGLCSADFCPAGSKWIQKAVSYSGFGCAADDGDGLYCSTIGFDRMSTGIKTWICMQNKNSDTACCMSNTFGICQYGTCDASVCDVFNRTYTVEYTQSDGNYVHGCKLTKDTQTIYCTPFNNSGAVGQTGTVWYCARTNNLGTGVCGRNCTVDGINNGECGDCFGDPSCPNWTINKTTVETRFIEGNTVDKDICQGTYDGTTYQCQKNGGQCFVGGKECGRNATSAGSGPATRSQGVCLASTCPEGTTWIESGNGLPYFGCSSTRNGIEYVNTHNSWNGDPCYYRKEGTNDKYALCAEGCADSMDCSNCTRPIADACTPTAVCRTDGMKIENCTCPGNPSAGHCCVKNHTYVNGGCAILPPPNGKCYYGDTPIDETDDYAAPAGSVNCACRDASLCMDDSGNLPVCGECSEIEEILDEE